MNRIKLITVLTYLAITISFINLIFSLNNISRFKSFSARVIDVQIPDKQSLIFSYNEWIFSGIIGFIALYVFITYIFYKYSSYKEKESWIVSIGALIDDKIETLKEGNNVIDAFEIFLEDEVCAIPIIADNKLVGVVEKKDIIQKVKDLRYDNLNKIKMKDLMDKNKEHYCTKEAKLQDIIELMEKNKYEAIIVVNENNEPEGLIDYFDILRFSNGIKKFTMNNLLIQGEMKSNFPKINSESNILELKDLFLKEKTDSAIVMENSKMIGIITLKDLIFSLYNGNDLTKTKVKSIGSQKVSTLYPGSRFSEVIDLFLNKYFSQIPIIEKDNVVGMIYLKDVLNAFYDSIKYKIIKSV